MSKKEHSQVQPSAILQLLGELYWGSEEKLRGALQDEYDCISTVS